MSAAVRFSTPARLAAASFVLMLASLILTARSVDVALRSDEGADIRRQWVVCEYVIRGVNPYRVGLDLLTRRYGPPGSIDLRKVRIYAIPKLRADDEVKGVFRDLGAPKRHIHHRSSLVWP